MYECIFNLSVTSCNTAPPRCDKVFAGIDSTTSEIILMEFLPIEPSLWFSLALGLLLS